LVSHPKLEINSKNFMIITLAIVGVVLTILFIGKINLSIKFRNQVKELFAQSTSISNQRFYKNQLVGLPDPVQRYFNHILKEGQPYQSCARIKHLGQFKTGIDKDWINIKGEQYAITEKPGFIWKGTTSMFVARDMYIADKGRLVVSLLSLFNVVNAKGEQYDQGELLRWLGESVMYPTNFLPSENLNWLPIDENSAQLTFNYQGFSLFFKVTFNQVGEITELETKRYMHLENLERWVIKTTLYKRFSDVLIPTAFDVIWRLEYGDFSYAHFIITEVEYNKAEKF